MYRKKAQGWIKHLDFLFWDIICQQISFLVAYMIRHGWQNLYEDEIYRDMAMVLVLIDIVIAIFFNSLKNVLKRGRLREVVVTVKHVCLVVLIAAFYLFIIQDATEFSRTTLLNFGVLYFIITYLVRITWKRYLMSQMQSSEKHSLLIVTQASKVDELMEDICLHNYEMFHIKGIAIIDEDRVGELIGDVEVVANKETVIGYACREWVDEVFISVNEGRKLPGELINSFNEMGLTVHTELAESVSLEGQQTFVENIGRYAVLTTTIHTATGTQLFLKRLMDIAGGLVGCLFTGILCIFLAPAIYIQSPGPIFFKQERVGQNGKRFKIYKFRSMYMDAEERKKELMKQNRVKDGMMFKLEFDPRIIGSKKLANGTVKKGVGNWIRDWSLDEFPQFFNILKGDMSLVGTRPPTVDEWEKYELHHRARLATKPGLTGMWQVSGRSNITDFEDVVKLDRQYIAEWTFGLDIKILFKTVGAVLKKEGSM